MQCINRTPAVCKNLSSTLQEGVPPFMVHSSVKWRSIYSNDPTSGSMLKVDIFRTLSKREFVLLEDSGQAHINLHTWLLSICYSTRSAKSWERHAPVHDRSLCLFDKSQCCEGNQIHLLRERSVVSSRHYLEKRRLSVRFDKTVNWQVQIIRWKFNLANASNFDS